ncbi:MAG: hypothetical protein DSZ32_02150 [Gammaproteobacteria bacterium]|nr:MAG: hypothetical protein DSZ32_02150 [Gammaproteobacteria bacterium]
MMRLFLKFGFIFVLLLLSAASATELWSRHNGLLTLDSSLDDQARQALEQNRPADARIMAEFVLEHPDSGDTQKAQAVADSATAQINSNKRKLHQFAKGAWSGEPDDAASFLGSLSLDLFVIGDIRDLVVQGWKQWKTKDGDEFIMALSAAGLAASLAPEIHWAPSMMKAFKRTGSLSKPFISSLKTTGKQALKTRKFGALSDVLKDFGKAGKKLGPGPFSTVMRNVDSAAELKKISKAASVDPKATYVLATRFGKNGIKRIGKNGANVGRLAKKIRILSRAGKIGKKAFGALPDWLLGLMTMLGLGITVWLTRPGQSRKFRESISRIPPPNENAQ